MTNTEPACTVTASCIEADHHAGPCETAPATVTYRIRGTNKLRSMLDEAVAASCWFAVTQLPDDGYALEVKNESGLLARFDAINADREAGSWP